MIFKLILLFILTIIGGSIPLWYAQWRERDLNALLAFSASFLMGISLLHLMPETYGYLGEKGGIYILIGFLGQSLLQKYTHGFEHGHSPHPHHKGISLAPLAIGMSFHALFEGIPLGLTQEDNFSLFYAILFHKIPESIVVVSFLFYTFKNKLKSWFFLILFALLTPLSATISYYFNYSFTNNSNFYPIILALISGVFFQISSTIYFEISNNKHVIKKHKWFFIILGFLLSLISINFH